MYGREISLNSLKSPYRTRLSCNPLFLLRRKPGPPRPVFPGKPPRSSLDSPDFRNSAAPSLSASGRRPGLLPLPHPQSPQIRDPKGRGAGTGGAPSGPPFAGFDTRGRLVVAIRAWAGVQFIPWFGADIAIPLAGQAGRRHLVGRGVMNCPRQPQRAIGQVRQIVRQGAQVSQVNGEARRGGERQGRGAAAGAAIGGFVGRPDGLPGRDVAPAILADHITVQNGPIIGNRFPSIRRHRPNQTRALPDTF